MRDGMTMTAWVMLALAAVTACAAHDDGRYHLRLGFAEGVAARVPVLAAVKTAAVAGGDDETDADYGAGTTLILERRDGAWAPTLCGEGPEAFGMVRDAVETDGQWRVTVDVLVGGIQRARNWLSRGNAVDGEYALRFRAVDGRLTGTFSGALGGQAVEGALAGTVAALGGPGRAMAPKGEHPRFLFRREQLAELRKKMETPWGKGMRARLEEEGWSRSGMAVGQGLLYQLTGDTKHAERARQLFRDDMRSGWWKAIGPIHDPAHKATEAVLAYDLVYDTCDAGFRAEMRTFLRGMLRHLYDYAEINSGNGHPYSNWSAQYRASVGMVALMLLADDAEEETVAGTDVEWSAPRVAPPADFAVKEGMPVLPVGDAPLRKWLYAGPLNIGLEHDGLSALGGVARAWPTDGTTFVTKAKAKAREDEVSGKFPQAILFKNARPRPRNIGVKGDDLQPLTVEVEGSFRPVPEAILIGKTEYVEGMGSPGMLHAWRAAGLRSFQTLYYFAVLDVPEAQTVQVGLTGGNGDWYYHNSALYISGRRFQHADVLRLEAGKHPVMRAMTVGMLCEAHVRHHLYDDVRLKRLDAAAEEKARTLKSAEARFRQRCAATLRAKGSREDLEALLWLPIARRAMEQYSSTAIGDRGWHSAGQCYTQHPLRVAMPFEHAHRSATGVGVSAGSHLGWFLGQAAARTVFSPEWARMQDYGRGGGPVGVDLYSRGYALVPEEARAETMWAWRKTMALTEARRFSAPELAVEEWDPMSAAFAVVNLPPDEAQDVGRDARPIRAPQALYDTQRLGWTFAKRWRDANDIVATFTGFRHPGGDWPCEGAALDLRMQGLGAEWIVRGNGKVTDPTSTVLVEGATGEPQAATVRHWSAGPNGDGTVTLGYKLAPKGEGVRGFAVDYSGKCGAPALFVVADDIQFVTPPRRPAPPAPAVTIPSLPPLDDDPLPPLPPAVVSLPPPPPPNTWRLVTEVENAVTILPDGFRIASAGGAVLHGTVITPAKAPISVEEVKHSIEINYRFDHSGGTFTRKVISVGGEGRFLVVMTLTRGDAPKVTRDGERVLVGGQEVRWDGEKAEVGELR